VTYHEGDLLDEEQWRLFSQATAAAGVATALSLPIVREGRVLAGINLYAGSEDAFDGHHEELAGLAGGWAAGAVANADLSFSTRLQAAEAPPRARVRQAAARAGITEGQAAGDHPRAAHALTPVSRAATAAG
jgi:GAF domain-containing protein